MSLETNECNSKVLAIRKQVKHSLEFVFLLFA